MKTKVYLHLGTGKTGSTALQALLGSNKDYLDSIGVSYVGNLATEASGFYDFARYIQSAEGHDYLHAISNLSSIFGDISKDRALIYSNETYYGSVKVLQSYRLAIGNHPYQVIVYLRRQDEFLQAHYAQTVVDPNIRETLPIGKISFDPDHYRLLTLYIKIFGKHNISVRLYQKSSFLGGTLFKDFFATCNLPWSDCIALPAKDLVNESRSRLFIELLRRANRDFPKHMHQQIIDKLIATLREDAIKPSSEKYSFLTDDEKTSIMHKYKKSNQMVAKEFLEKVDNNLFEPAVASSGIAASMSDEYLDRFYNEIFGI